MRKLLPILSFSSKRSRGIAVFAFLLLVFINQSQALSVNAQECGTWSCSNCIIGSCRFRASDNYCYNGPTTPSGPVSCLVYGSPLTCKTVTIYDIDTCNGYMTSSECFAQNRDGTRNCAGVPSCIVGPWVNRACGGGTCADDRRLQTRTVSPATCPDATSRCVADASCPETSPPPCPGGYGVSCNAAGNSATINWNDLSGITNWYTRVNRNPYGDWVGPGDFAYSSGVSQITVPVVPNITYQYDAQACNTWPCTGLRCFASFMCSPPVSCGVPTLSGSRSCSGSSPRANLSWNAVASCTENRIYKCTGASCTPTTHFASTTNATSFSDDAVSSGTTYRYRIRACNSSGCGSYSNIVTITPDDCVIPPECISCSNSPGSCGVGSCNSNERLYTRICNPPNTTDCPTHGSTFCQNDEACETCISCSESSGSCGGGSCASTDRLYTTTCNPPNTTDCPTHGNTRCLPDLNCDPEPSCDDCHWEDQDCGGGSCPIYRRSQRRVCSDTDCEEHGDTRCVDDSICIPSCDVPNQPTVIPSCELDGEVTIDCDWDSVADADQYRVQIQRDGVTIVDTTTSSSSRVLYNQPPGPTYICQVRVETSDAVCDEPGFYSSYGSTTVADEMCTTCDLSFNALPDIYPGETRKPTWNTLDDDEDKINYITYRLDDNTNVAVCSTNDVECFAVNPNPFEEDRDNPGEGPAWGAQVTGLSIGTTTLRATGYMINVPSAGLTRECQNVATVDINVINPPAWWQVRGGDIISTGSIKSSVEGCIFPTCLDYLDVALNPGFSPNYDPGLPIYGGSVIPSTEDISSKGWNAYSPYAGYNTRKEVLYTYDYFKSRVKTTELDPETLDSSEDVDKLYGGGMDTHGYYIVSAAGDLNIDWPINVGDRKVIIFVNGKLRINDTIRLNDGKGFFLAIVKGDIEVNSSVGHAPADVSTLVNPELQGLFFTEGQFDTGESALQLYVRGSIAALGNASGNPVTFSDEGILLKRNLLNNAAHPAQYFEYAPDLLFNFPPSLGEKTIKWVETAP